MRLVQADDLRGYGQVHFFAGIGGGALACRMAGVPDDFSITTAGVPCQPASVAGNRLGESDERWLWPEFLRLLGDRVLRHHYALVENPPGILTLADGGAFAGILASLAEMRRDVEWSCVSAADVGACHERERVWIVAYPGRGSFQPLRNAGTVGGASAEDGSEGLQRERRSTATPGRGEDGSTRPVADADGGRHEQRQRRQSAAETPRGEFKGGTAGRSTDGSARTLADPDAHGSCGLAPHDGAHGGMDIEPGNDSDRCGDHRGRAVGREADGGRNGARSAQSAVGRTADGLPAYLGGAEWVAPPGEAQHAWEEPRLVASLDTNGRKALAAFGNAWVPQAAVPALRVILAHAMEASA
jgi:DNA (cytosine-5)-methyltransferase 1